MNAIRNLLINMRRVLAGAGEVVRYALIFLWGIFCPKAVLAAKLLAAESQLAACKHEIASKKRLRPRFFDHSRREVVHSAVTRHPDMNWVIQQLRESMPFGLQPRYLFRDNDGLYGNGVRAFLDRCGIEEVRTAYRSPWQNPVVERFIGTRRRKLLDHVIVLSPSHLERLLRQYIEEYYHVARPHQGLDGDTPVSQTNRPQILGPSKLISIPVLGGLHHRYVRVAA